MRTFVFNNREYEGMRSRTTHQGLFKLNEIWFMPLFHDGTYQYSYVTSIQDWGC